MPSELQRATSPLHSPDVYARGYLLRKDKLTKGENDTKNVEDNISHRVLRQSLNTRIPNESTPKPTQELDNNRRSHDSDCRNRELHYRMVLARHAGETLDGNLEERGNHDD